MTRYSFVFSALMSTAAAAEGAAYSQCGGSGWTGAVTCVSGYHCQAQNEWYSQCVPGAAEPAKAVAATSKTAQTSKAVQTSKAAPTKTAAATTLITVHRSTSAATPTAAIQSSSPAAAAGQSSGRTSYAGVNIAGFDFGCSTDGSCSGAYVDPGANGIEQMKHFASADKLNSFRLPIGWQHLVNNQLGGALDATVFAAYDKLVQACLATGALCILDLHNYARWNGAIVGQGGPTDAQFADVWSRLAAEYKTEKNIAFGVMNEPHDLTMSTWAKSVQAAVTAIRDAGAKSQYILLPGTDYTSAGSFVQNSGPALLDVTDADGSAAKLIFDVHRYLDADNSGTNAECTSDHVADSFTPLAEWLRSNKRQAFVSEIGGGNTASCEQYACAALAAINKDSDVYLGYAGWAAGAFDTSYVLSMTPTGGSDTGLMAKCFSRA